MDTLSAKALTGALTPLSIHLQGRVDVTCTEAGIHAALASGAV